MKIPDIKIPDLLKKHGGKPAGKDTMQARALSSQPEDIDDFDDFDDSDGQSSAAPDSFRPRTADDEPHPRTVTNDDLQAAAMAAVSSMNAGQTAKTKPAKNMLGALSDVLGGSNGTRFADPEKKPTRYASPTFSKKPAAASDGTYIPPESLLSSGSRLRYKKRNRRPMRMWAKATLTGLAVVFFFSALIYMIFSGMIMGRINYTGDSTRNMVRLTKTEQIKLQDDRTDFSDDPDVFTQPAVVATQDENIRIILLVSSDNSLGDEKSAQCDALMLAVFDSTNHSIKLISIMSDLYVRIPGYYSNKISKAYYYDTANGDYTLPTLKQTIQDNLGIIIDNYVVVDFSAIQTIVNRMGGVDMELTQEEALYMSTDPKYGNFPRYTNEGSYTMTGAETLNYIRIVNMGFGDYDRVLRQRKVLFQLISKFKDMSFMELSELAYAVLPLLPTDMTKDDVWDMLWDTAELSQYEISQLTFPIVGSWRYGNATVQGEKLDLIVTNLEFNADALADFIYDDDRTYIGSYAEEVVIPDIAPEDVPVTSDSDVAADGADEE